MCIAIEGQSWTRLSLHWKRSAVAAGPTHIGRVVERCNVQRAVHAVAALAVWVAAHLQRLFNRQQALAPVALILALG